LVRRTLSRGETELRLRLDPPRLGRVDVDLRVDDDRVGIRFTVDTHEVRETLRTHLAELQQALGAAGWSAESIDIDLSGGGERSGGFDPAPGGAASPEEGDRPLEQERDPSEIRLWHLGRAVDLRG